VYVLDPAVAALDAARADGQVTAVPPPRRGGRLLPPVLDGQRVDLRTLDPSRISPETARSLRWAVALRQALERARGDRPGPPCQAHQGRLNVLRGLRVPAVVAELGYLTDRDDSRLLADPAVQRRMARALAEVMAVFSPDAPPDPACAAR
jgi:N-acetylmuramoyl-L-alanine amidase